MTPLDKLLSPFAAPRNSTRVYLHGWWVEGGRAYATDGHVAIRAKERPGLPDGDYGRSFTAVRPIRPGLPALFAECYWPSLWLTVPVDPLFRALQTAIQWGWWRRGSKRGHIRLRVTGGRLVATLVCRIWGERADFVISTVTSEDGSDAPEWTADYRVCDLKRVLAPCKPDSTLRLGLPPDRFTALWVEADYGDVLVTAEARQP